MSIVRYPDIRIFDLGTEDFLDDIANFKDTSHYLQRYNSAMLHWMKNGEHELTPENLEPHIQEITARAAVYQPKEIGRQINEHLIPAAKFTMFCFPSTR